MSEKKIPVHIPESLYRAVEQRVKSSSGEFKSVEEYIEFILNEVVKEEPEEEKQTYTPEEEEEVKKRLKALGYL